MVPRWHGALKPYPTCPAALSLWLCGTALGAALEHERRDSLVLELWEQVSLSPKPSCLDFPSGFHLDVPLGFRLDFPSGFQLDLPSGSTLTSPQVSALTSPQVSALTSLQVSSLTSPQVSTLTPPQVSLADLHHALTPKQPPERTTMTGLGRHVAMGGGGLTEALSERGAQCWGGLLGIPGRVDRAGSRGSEESC